MNFSVSAILPIDKFSDSSRLTTTVPLVAVTEFVRAVTLLEPLELPAVSRTEPFCSAVFITVASETTA